MLLPTPPTLIYLVQAASPKEELVTTVYDLRHVSPAYFLQELDSPWKPRRPAGVASITPDDVRSIITVKATPAGHAALKSLLEKIDVVFEPDSAKKAEPAFSEVRIVTKVAGEVEVLPYPTIAITKGATGEIGIWTEEELSGYLKSQRPFNYVMVSPSYLLKVTPHFSQDEKTVLLEYSLRTRQRPKDLLISLGTQTITVGTSVRMVFSGSPAFTDKQEFFVRVQRHHQ